MKNERRRIERETDDEILAHLSHRVDDLVARGMSRRAAEEEALRRFGPYDTGRADMLAAARHRDRYLTMIDHIDALRHDVSSAIRRVFRAPALAITVVGTFALGIGANATMFGLIDRMLLRPPRHIAAPEQVVRVQWKVVTSPRDTFVNTTLSYPAYEAVRDKVPAFSAVAMQTFSNQVSFGTGADARPIRHVLVSGTYFSTLGVRMVAGRPILPDDDVLPTGSPVVVIGYGLWQSEFGGQHDAIGKAINLANRKYTVIGVAPADFIGVGTRPIDAWIPVSAAEGLRFAGADWATNADFTWMSVIGRLDTGITPELAGQQVAAVIRELKSGAQGKRDTTTLATPQASILPRKATKLGPNSQVALLLGAVSTLVLLIACANVANLLLARALRRRREIAVRLALGIARGRLIRQLLIEGKTLAALGGAASLLVVQLGGAFLYRVLLTDSARPTSFVDERVVLFALVATMIVGLATSLVPAIQSSRPNLASDLKEGTRGAGVSHSATRTALLLVQAALSVVLLVGTGAFVLSLRKIDAISPGLDLDRLVVGQIDLRSVGIDSTRAAQYYNDALEAVRRIPGVESASIVQGSPFTGWSLGTAFRIPGRDSVPSFDRGPNGHGVDEAYFRTVGTRILRGRGFERGDLGLFAERVLIINESAARRLWPAGDAVGQCLLGAKTDTTGVCARIVGVAEDTRMGELLETGTQMQLYRPIGQGSALWRRAFMIVARAADDPAQIIEPVRRAMQTVYASLPYATVQPMRASLDNQLRPWRLGATLFGVFGAIALVLSSLGLYSVVSYSVAQRTHEMGVRVALGAQMHDIVRLVLRQGLGVAAVGILIGLTITFFAARFVKPLLYQTSANEPLILATVAALLLFVATLAALGPARRATKADPLTALRAE